jgi:large subunit ribosomal protein L24
VIKLKIKKGATVQVITGADKGKKGTVLAVDANSMKIQVQGVKIQTHFDKKEGLLKKEGFFDYSNVKLLDTPTKEKKTSKKAAKSKSA